MRKTLHNVRDFHVKIHMAACLKVVMAKNIKIAEDEFKIIMPKSKKSFKPEKKPRPERKQF